MASTRFFVDRHDGEGGKRQVGGGSKTGDKADRLKQEMRQAQPRGSSASFTVRKGRK